MERDAINSRRVPASAGFLAT